MSWWGGTRMQVGRKGQRASERKAGWREGECPWKAQERDAQQAAESSKAEFKPVTELEGKDIEINTFPNSNLIRGTSRREKTPGRAQARTVNRWMLWSQDLVCLPRWFLPVTLFTLSAPGPGGSDYYPHLAGRKLRAMEGLACVCRDVAERRLELGILVPKAVHFTLPTGGFRQEVSGG